MHIKLLAGEGKGARQRSSTGGEDQAMGQRERPRGEELKVTFEAVVGRQGGKGIFGIEEAAEAVARQTKLAQMAERIARL